MEKNEFTNCHVLWIEDQDDEYYSLLERLENLLTKQNFETAHTVDEGLIKLRQNKYNLLLLDLMLPENEEARELQLIDLDGGLGILRELRKSSGWETDKNCMTLVFTARGNGKTLKEVEELLNANGELIEKPSPIQNIFDLVKKRLETLSSK